MSIVQHYRTEQLAERLSINPQTLRRAAQRGELRPVRIGRNLHWPEPEVLAWLERQRQPEGVGEKMSVA